MNRLAVIAIAGLGVSVVSLAAAIGIGARSDKLNMDWHWFDGENECPAVNATATSRSFDWKDGDEVTIEVPANVHYRPGQGTQLVIAGDPAILAHVRVEGGSIDLSCGVHHWRHQRLDVTLPGNRTFREFNLKGLTSVDLHDLDQPALEINLAGKGDVTANGKTDDLKLDLAGHGEIHARELIAKKLDLNIAGHGAVETSPQDSADISIAGHGEVKLYSEPKHIDTSILGSGNIQHLAPKS